MCADTPFESTRRRLSPQQARTVERLTGAAVTVVRRRGYSGLTVRLVAAEAGVAAATAYTYFSSKNHLIAEVFWRRLAALPEPPADGRTRLDRVTTVMRDVGLLVSDEPELAAAVTAALLGDDPEVAHLRLRIGLNIRDKLARALEPEAPDPASTADPDVLEALESMWSGALLRAGMGYQTYTEIADRFEAYARLVLTDTR